MSWPESTALSLVQTKCPKWHKTISAFKHGDGSVMLWANIFSWKDWKTCFHQVQPEVKFRQIAKEKMSSSSANLHLNQWHIFFLDSGPKQKVLWRNVGTVLLIVQTKFQLKIHGVTWLFQFTYCILHWLELDYHTNKNCSKSVCTKIKHRHPRKL